MIDSTTRIRLARPSKNLAAAERFYVTGLGLQVLWRTTERAPGTHDLLMVGPSDATWHLELTHNPEQPLTPAPTVDDLLVIYLGAPVDPALTARLENHGGTKVPAHNPYWDQHGVTVRDPDGYLLVLCSRNWAA
ncbi:VOC family protein [Streptomyces sp. NPDC015237]|uniref:VOC family protein n=1 Tax=Streptomyces sp. NPDC015237 TaxID=3364949 RepID=UPI0036FF2A6A